MSFESWDEWKAYAPTDILDVIKQGAPPRNWDDCRNTRWERVLVFFCENNYSLENLNFLWAVSEYRSNARVGMAEDIIENIIYGNQPLNLYSETSAPIDDWYKDQEHDLKVDLFDRAEREVAGHFSSTFSHFVSSVNKARRDLLNGEEPG